MIQSLMCPHCEEEGEIYVRTARDLSHPTGYDPKNISTFVDIVGFDPKGAHLRVKPGDWVEAEILCFGYMKRIRASRVAIEGNILASGSLKVGRATLEEGRLFVDFGVFRAGLTAQTETEMEKVIKRQRIHDGAFVATDCSVDIEIKAVRQHISSKDRRTEKNRK